MRPDLLIARRRLSGSSGGRPAVAQAAGFGFVQSAYGSTSVSSFTVSATYTSNVLAGNKLIALMSTDAASGPTVTASDGTNSMTLVGRATAAAVTSVLFAMDVPAGDVGTKPTITATSTAQGDMGILIQEVSGLAVGNTLAAMLDGTAGTSTGSGGGSTTSPTYSSTAPDEYLACTFGDDAFTDTIGTPAGYTADPNNPAGATVHTLICYKKSTNAAESGVYTYSNAAAAYGSILCAFKLA